MGGRWLIKIWIVPRIGVPPLTISIPISIPLTLVVSSSVAPEGVRGPVMTRISVTIPIVRARLAAQT